MAEIENEIARSNLETVNIKTRVELLLKIQENLDKEMVVKNDIITKSMLDTEKRNTLIERKQSLIDQYNKKLESMINAAGVSNSILCIIYICDRYRPRSR